MEDINCPYCDAAQDINHDDGYGYDQSVTHEQQCYKCKKTFAFTTSISFNYDVYKADCLNGADHVYKPTCTYPVEFTEMECVMCGDVRRPTESEIEEIIKIRNNNKS